MDAENRESCSQRDSAERKGYVKAHRSFKRVWKERDSAQPELLEKILDKDNFNRAFKKVKANKGAPGLISYMHSFGCFASRKCFDQAFLSAEYSKLPVHIISSDPGVTVMFNGATHMPFERGLARALRAKAGKAQLHCVFLIKQRGENCSKRRN